MHEALCTLIALYLLETTRNPKESLNKNIQARNPKEPLNKNIQARNL
jgi:hypothetical protein